MNVEALFYEVLGPSTFTNDPALIHDELISFERNTTPDGINVMVMGNK